MDNARSNKSWATLSGLAALVCSGIAEKIKLSFCLASHAHTDIDATIAKVVAAICKTNMRTFEEFKNGCIRSIAHEGSQVLDVVVLTGIPSYDTALRGFENSEMTGVCAAHEFRLTPNNTQTGVDLFYRVDLRHPGWLPR